LEASALKNCPFCGSDVVVEFPDTSRGEQYDVIHHHTRSPAWCPLLPLVIRADHWNRRAPRFTAEEREALDEAIYTLEAAVQGLPEKYHRVVEKNRATATLRRMLETEK